MKIRSLILYGSNTKLTNAHKLVTTQVNSPLLTDQPKYYVRAKASRYDYTVALQHAQPREGETVLNTVPIE